MRKPDSHQHSARAAPRRTRLRPGRRRSARAHSRFRSKDEHDVTRHFIRRTSQDILAQTPALPPVEPTDVSDEPATDNKAQSKEGDGEPTLPRADGTFPGSAAPEYDTETDCEGSEKPACIVEDETWMREMILGQHTATASGDELDDTLRLTMPPKPQLSIAHEVEATSLEDLVNSGEVYNVELSWLAFNWRVLSMALLPDVPLLERLQFLAIASSNLDGFFQKRVGGLMKQQAAGLQNMKANLRQTPSDQLAAISAEVKRMSRWHSWALQRLVLPQLQAVGVRLVTPEALSAAGKEYLRKFYVQEVDKLLTPIKLDPAHPFPYLPSGSLNLAVELRDPGEATLEQRGMCAIVNIPSSLPKWIEVPSEYDATGEGSWEHGFVSLQAVITQNLNCLFAGMRIGSAHCFRVTRNAELDRQEDEAEDLLDMIADEVRERRFAPFVRLEVEAHMPRDLTEFLVHRLALKPDQDVYRMPHVLDLEQLSRTTRLVSHDPALTYEPWKPTVHPRLHNPFKRRLYRQNWSGKKWKDVRSIFDVVRDGDLLLHHPYQSFSSSTQRFVDEAARDPQVVAIKATLYRTSSDSPIITSLLKAADNGKQVAVLVELKARFDEARNVGFATRLEEAGCNVAYGIVGLKTHAKCMLVVRREKSAAFGLRTYVHIGTGNYNPSTASLYTDMGVLSCDPQLGEDVVDMFKFLTGIHLQRAVGGFRKLLVGNEYMKAQLLTLIDSEIESAKAGHPAALCIKVNGLDDTTMVAKLYEAADAGVRVDCIVRGVCRLRPGIPGRSENIRVVSIIGRFLEHHRIYTFHNRGKPLYYIASADWMKRNLNNRIEVGVPVQRARSMDRLREQLSMCLLDKWAWEMLPDGSYRRPATRTDEAGRSSVLLGQPGYPPEQLQQLEEKGTQACLMWSILHKIQARSDDGKAAEKFF